MAANPCPALPNELWHKVLENFRKENDLPDLWMSYRFVSTAFKTAVESIFREKHLRKTWIRYDLGTYHADDDARVTLNIEFKFSHLSEDKNIATFKIEDFHEDYRSEIVEHLKECLEEDMTIEEPQHYVQVHRDLNDTPIPGFSIDYEKLEFTCDWRGLYTRFYGEDQLYGKYTKAWVEEKEDWSKSIWEQVERGELEMMEAIQRALQTFGKGSDNSIKKARRARMKHQFRERGEEPDFDLPKGLENDQLKKMALARQRASLEHDSEYEFDGEDEDEAESDEWETDNSEVENENEDEDIEEVEEHLDSHT